MRYEVIKLCTGSVEDSNGWCLAVLSQVEAVREGFKKSKWKFKMAFAMKGGCLKGVSFAIYLF